MALVEIGNSLGWLAFLSLIPLIILYLIRPKPQTLEIPSLMFFLRAYDSKTKRSYLRRFIKDWLFLIQFLILLALSLTMLSPFIFVNQSFVAKNAAIVLDASASMQVGNRFNTAVEAARKNLGSRNTLVLVKEVPQIALKDKSSSEVNSYLDGVVPTDSGSKIGDAILLAGEGLGENGKVVVISDFVNTVGTEPETAVSVLRSKGIFVDLINIGEKERKKNFGVVGVSADDVSTIINVKNFENDSKSLTISVNGLERKLVAGPRSIEPYVFKTPEGMTKFEIKDKDDLSVDNSAYVSAPEYSAIKILLITNEKSVYLKSALTSFGKVNLDIAEPPIIPSGDYDVYIFQNVDPGSLVAGTFEEIGKKVEDGASLVIYAQNNINTIDWKGLLPVDVYAVGGVAVASVVQANRFTKDIDFGKVDSHLRANDKVGSIRLVSGQNSSLVALKDYGKGKILYYGILDSASDFKFSPDYPIFWVNAIKFLTNQQDINGLNYRSGERLNFGKKIKIQTPGGVVEEDSISLDKAGIYSFGNKKIAVNLVNEKESDIESEDKGFTAEEFVLGKVEEKVEYNLEVPLLIIIAVLLFFEIVYVKVRGDL